MSANNPMVFPPVTFWSGEEWLINIKIILLSSPDGTFPVLDDTLVGLDVLTPKSPTLGGDIFLSGYLLTGEKGWKQAATDPRALPSDWLPLLPKVTHLASSGTISVSGKFRTLSADNGPWTLTGNAFFVDIAEYKSAPVTYITAPKSTITAENVYISPGSSVGVTRVKDVSFAGGLGLLTLSGKDTKFSVDGFKEKSTILFDSQSPESALFSYQLSSSGSAEIYEARDKIVYSVRFSDLDQSSKDLIKPMSDGQGGLKLVKDTFLPLVDPDASHIDWSFIHRNESFELSPYKPPGAKSGVTVGYGVDMGGKVVTVAVFAALFGTSWMDNPNLVWLSNTISHQGTAAEADIKNTTWTYHRHNVTTREVSITSSEANSLTQYVENALYKDLVRQWNAKASVQFSGLSGDAATVVMDYFYSHSRTFLSSQWFKAAEGGNWSPMLTELLKEASNSGRARDQYSRLAGSPEAQSATSERIGTLSEGDDGRVSGLVEQGVTTVITRSGTPDTTTAPTQALSMSAVSASLLADAPPGTFMFVETSESPRIASIEMPDDAEHYQISALADGVWSPFQRAEPYSQVVFKEGGVVGVRVTPLDDNYQFVEAHGFEPFTFYLTFTTTGNVTGDMTELGVTPLTPPPEPLEPPELTVPCFCSGTRIMTPDGEAVIDELMPNTHLKLHSSGSAPIIWIGHRHVDCRRHPQPEMVWPVRVNAGALGDGVPTRDLWLSPDHAIYVQETLIPIKYLINGTSIAQVPVDDVTYYHIELDRHDIILAESLPCESYLDTGDRSNFANGDRTMRLFPDFASHSRDVLELREAYGYAPLVIYGPVLEAVRLFVGTKAKEIPITTSSIGRC